MKKNDKLCKNITEKISLIILLMFFSIAYLMAQTGEALKHHVIVAVDKAGCDGWIANNEVVNRINHLLFKNTTTNCGNRMHLYEKEDYMSLLGFCIDASQTDMKVFAMPLGRDGENIAYQSFSEYELKSLIDNRWKNIVEQDYNRGENRFSLVSIAKPYSLMALNTDEKKVNRTFLILVTDHHYNGNDFYDEIVSLTQKQREINISNALTPDKVFEKCYKVEQNYFIRYISTDTIRGNRSYVPQGYVEFYEFVPLQQNFALSSVINYPTHIQAIRRRDGTYHIDVPLQWRGNMQYKLCRLDVFACDGNSARYTTPANAITLSHCDTLVSFNVGRDMQISGIGLRAWLNLQDGVYGATVMSPSVNAPEQAGRNGLNIIIPVQKEPDATTIFGLPLLDCFWIPFFDSQYTAAEFWKYFWVAVVLLFLIWYFSRPIHYHPTKKDFSLKKQNDK